MLKPILSIFAISIATSFQVTASTQIDSKDAPFHEGEDVIACGLIKQVSRFKRGFYLNMDERYLNSHRLDRHLLVRQND